MSPSEQRLRVLIKEIDGIVQDIAPKMIKLGHLRSEMRLLLDEIEGQKDEQEGA